jgi:hypothetical protein
VSTHLPPSQRRVRIPAVPEDTGPDDTVARLRGLGRYLTERDRSGPPEPSAIERHAARMAETRTTP